MSDEGSEILFGASNVYKLTHKSKRQCQRIVIAIRKYVKKKDEQPVTYFDAADFFGIPPDEIRKLAY